MTQECWQKLKDNSTDRSRDVDGAQLLRVIAHAAARFPHAQAVALTRDLLKV